MSRTWTSSVLAAVLAVAAACGDDAPAAVCQGERLFGQPSASTGLGADQCGPSCTCQGEPWSPPAYGPADVAALKAWTLLDPPAEVTTDPYAEAAAPPPPPGELCGAQVDPVARTYRLATYANAEALAAAGARVTHAGACGVCSTCADLAVYMGQPDLTGPVRQCGVDHAGGEPAEHIACLQDLGFTLPCAQIWYFNTLNTRAECLAPCLFALDQPYHLPDGSLNECLVCDEENSGPVFKAVAGRTRRNTGLATALCRPCTEVQPIVHAYE
ncbi:MAG: hypothetical protein R2939_15225 [Kofleriaceae bacterium]